MVEPDTIGATRAEPPFVLALDIGSSSIKGAIHDALGRTVRDSVVQLRYGWETAPGGAVRLPATVFLELVDQALDALDGAVARLGIDLGAAGIACLVHSICGLEATGSPMTPVLSWADTTSATEAATLRTRLDPVITHATTGAPIHGGYWPARILRLREEQPGIRRWAGLAELVTAHLTGRAVVSRSMASGTGLLDRATGSWATGPMQAVAIKPDQLPSIHDDQVPVGRLTATAAKRWPHLAACDWFAPWGDGGCGNVGLGAMGTGRAALMVGTSGALRAVVDGTPPLPAGLFAQRLGSSTVIGGQLTEGGGTLAWASRLVGRSQRSLERAAAAMGADEHGLTVLPFTFGERGLGYHDAARASVVGLHADTDAVAIYRAFMESIAFGFAAVDDRLEAVLGTRPDVVAAGGSLSTSHALAQILADALGRDIAVAAAIEPSRRGAALLALAWSGHAAAANAPAPTTRTVRADADRAERYRAARTRRDVLYRTLLS